MYYIWKNIDRVGSGSHFYGREHFLEKKLSCDNGRDRITGERINYITGK